MESEFVLRISEYTEKPNIVVRIRFPREGHFICSLYQKGTDESDILKNVKKYLYEQVDKMEIDKSR